MTTTIDYKQQAKEFLEKTGTTFKATFIENAPYFDDDKESRDIWRITLRRVINGERYSFRFGQSIAAQGETPSAYDVLACLTKGDPGSFEEFCDSYGYDTDSRKALKTYKAVVKEWAGVKRLFSDVLEQLEEIQ